MAQGPRDGAAALVLIAQGPGQAQGAKEQRLLFRSEALASRTGSAPLRALANPAQHQLQ